VAGAMVEVFAQQKRAQQWHDYGPPLAAEELARDWPVNRNPVYVIAEGQRITRTEGMELTDIS